MAQKQRKDRPIKMARLTATGLWWTLGPQQFRLRHDRELLLVTGLH
jgi:hypothetical protein